MNKTTATHNATDIWEVWLDNYLKENPECWTTSCRAKRRSREFVYRQHGKIPRQDYEEVMSFTRWLLIIRTYYLVARKEVIKGRKIRFGHNIGGIRARRISRNFKNKTVNWNETNKQPYTINPETGKKKFERMIYYTSDTYCRIAWEKSKNLLNKTYYKFVPSRGSKARGGFRQEFVESIKSDPLLQTKYKQFINELI